MMRPLRFLTRHRVVAAVLGVTFVAASCSSAAGPATEAVEPEAAGESTSVADEPVQVVPPEPPVNRDAGVQRPLYESRPPLEVSVDSARVAANLPMGFEEWDGMSQEPPEPEMLGTAVADVGQILTFNPAHPAELTILMFQLGTETTFKRTMTVEGSASEIQLPVPEPGTWLFDIAATFGPAEEYAGSGVLRYGLWLQAVEPGAGCEEPQQTRLSAVTDDQGCPVPASLIRVDLDLALPWFHCSPWPPTLRWTNHPTTDATEFLRYDFGDASATVVEIPGDARATGFELVAGPILVSPSDPEALLVDVGAGMAERWLAPEQGMGCA